MHEDMTAPMRRVEPSPAGGSAFRPLSRRLNHVFEATAGDSIEAVFDGIGSVSVQFD